MKPGIYHLIIVLLLMTPQAALSGDTMKEQRDLINFSQPGGLQWYPVNDGVMGGLSASGLTVTDQGTGLFAGELSLANNGGFASVRTVVGPVDLSSFAGLEIRVRGDGRTYQLRLRSDGGFDGIAYRCFYETSANEWTVFRFAFADFEPTFRGRMVPGAPPLDLTRITQVAFMLADKRAGDFTLEIEYVRPWISPAAEPEGE